MTRPVHAKVVERQWNRQGGSSNTAAGRTKSLQRIQADAVRLEASEVEADREGDEQSALDDVRGNSTFRRDGRHGCGEEVQHVDAKCHVSFISTIKSARVRGGAGCWCWVLE